jgi:hypothetical protein
MSRRYEERLRKQTRRFWSVVEFAFFAVMIVSAYLLLWGIHHWLGG